MAIKKGDNVIVRQGKDRGKSAKVLHVHPSEGTAVVEGLNIAKRHQRPRGQGKKGQIVERAMPMKLSALSLVCSKCGVGRRFGSKMVGDKKVRACTKCGTEL
mgnify:FL=1